MRLTFLAASIVVVDLIILLTQILTRYGNFGRNIYAVLILVLNVAVCVGLLLRRASTRLVVISLATGLLDVTLAVFEIVGQADARYSSASSATFWVVFSLVNASVCLLGMSRFRNPVFP